MLAKKLKVVEKVEEAYTQAEIDQATTDLIRKIKQHPKIPKLQKIILLNALGLSRNMTSLIAHSRGAVRHGMVIKDKKII